MGLLHDEYDASNNVDLYPTVQLQRDRARMRIWRIYMCVCIYKIHTYTCIRRYMYIYTHAHTHRDGKAMRRLLQWMVSLNWLPYRFTHVKLSYRWAWNRFSDRNLLSKKYETATRNSIVQCPILLMAHYRFRSKIKIINLLNVCV